MAVKRPRRQCAALPLAMREDGLWIVLLVTSRGTRRWVLPKGWVERGVPDAEQAAREAFEEAGIVGDIADRPIGRYRYDKRLRTGRCISCRVDVFAMWVSGRLDDWPEKRQREAAWFTPAEAAALVEEAGLADILRGLDGAPPLPAVRRTASPAQTLPTAG